MGIKSKTVEELLEIRKNLKESGIKVVMTNGCFDLLHGGHIHLFREAKKYGDILIVALNDDVSIKKIKGPMRPIFKLSERIEILEGKRQMVPSKMFQGKLKPFQKSGLAFMVQNRRCILADETGLGKTVQAMAFLSKTKPWPALLVVEPHLTLQWERETQRFLKGVTTHRITGLKHYELPNVQIYIIHYLLLRAWERN